MRPNAQPATRGEDRRRRAPTGTPCAKRGRRNRTQSGTAPARGVDAPSQRAKPMGNRDGARHPKGDRPTHAPGPGPRSPVPERRRVPRRRERRATLASGCDDGKRKAPKRAVHSLEAMRKNSGSDLLSHNVTVAVPSAPKSLTSEFGMGSGGTSSISPPENFGLHRNPNSATERILRERLAEGGRTSSILPLRHDQASRPISTRQLRALQRFHTGPINLVVSEGS